MPEEQNAGVATPPEEIKDDKILPPEPTEPELVEDEEQI